MKRVATAAVLIPLVLLLIFRAPMWLMAVVLTLIAWLCLREYFALVRAHGIAAFERITMAAVLFAVAAPAYTRGDLPELSLAILGGFLLFGHLLLLSLGLARSDLRSILPGIGASLLGAAYVGVALLALFFLWTMRFGSLYVLHVLLVVWSGDIFAYYAGRNLGRHRLAPRVSPGKTWEGTAASFVGSVLLGTAILMSLPELHRVLGLGSGSLRPGQYGLWFAVLVSAVVNIAAQVGDLAESALKRGAGVKDSGALLPGHGGVLDRLDALLFSGPAGILVFLLAEWLYPPVRMVSY